MLTAWRPILVILVVSVISGCGSSGPTPTPIPPKLVSEITIAPGTKGAIIPSNTPTDTNTPVPLTDTPMPTPTDTITPTFSDTPEPPTDTPTYTLTYTRTSTITLTPTRTKRPSHTPTPTAPTPTWTPLSCNERWFFAPTPRICPLAAAETGVAGGQQFENGMMLWIGKENTIFVLYKATKKPRWQQFTDKYGPGVPDNDPSLTPPAGLIQPERGFGLVWRKSPGVRDRLGWATTPEQPYTGGYQVDLEGNRYVQSWDGLVYMLANNQSDWQQMK